MRIDYYGNGNSHGVGVQPLGGHHRKDWELDVSRNRGCDGRALTGDIVEKGKDSRSSNMRPAIATEPDQCNQWPLQRFGGCGSGQLLH